MQFNCLIYCLVVGSSPLLRYAMKMMLEKQSQMDSVISKPTHQLKRNKQKYCFQIIISLISCSSALNLLDKTVTVTIAIYHHFSIIHTRWPESVTQVFLQGFLLLLRKIHLLKHGIMVRSTSKIIC